MKKAVASAYVDRANPPNVDDYDCMVDEIIRVGGVLGDVSRGEMIKCPKAYVTPV